MMEKSVWRELMKIENKEMLLYSMNKAYDELAAVINDVNASCLLYTSPVVETV